MTELQWIIRGSLEVVEAYNSFHLYGKDRHHNDVHIAAIGTEPYVGDPNDDGELPEAYNFDPIWTTREMEEDFDYSKAYFGVDAVHGSMIYGIRRRSDSLWGKMPFTQTHEPRVYYNFMRE